MFVSKGFRRGGLSPPPFIQPVLPLVVVELGSIMFLIDSESSVSGCCKCPFIFGSARGDFNSEIKFLASARKVSLTCLLLMFSKIKYKINTRYTIVHAL